MIRAIRKFCFNRRGATTTEFAIAFPFFMWIMFMFAEIGVLSLRTGLLKRGLSMATYEARVGSTDVMNIAEFRNRVCEHTYAMSDCASSLNIEMSIIEDGNFAEFKCRNRENDDWTPATTFTPNVRNRIMLVRACILVNPVFPGAGIGADLSRGLNGEYAIVATTAIVTEPTR